MQARDVMTKDVISIEPGAPVLRAARLMLQNHISGLPVLNAQDQVVGIVTEGDFLRRGEIGTRRKRARCLEFLVGPGRLAAEYVRACGRKVDEIMTRDLYVVAPDTPLDEVVQVMEKHRVKRVPVIENGKLRGIVSRANLMYALATLAPGVSFSMTSDVAIRDQILEACNKERWAPSINVVVRDGVASLWGVIPDERERQALIVAAENVPGVKAVHDHLVWVEPMSAMVFLSEEDETQAKAS
jgi:CBS domain-containing protein